MPLTLKQAALFLIAVAALGCVTGSGQAPKETARPGLEYFKAAGGGRWIALNREERSFLLMEVKGDFVSKTHLTSWRGENGKYALYGNGVAGVLSIGIGRSATLYMPVFDIFGDRDPNRGQAQTRTTDTEAVRILPGGHQWNYPETHAEALRWLDSRKRR
jgi:hypothetical protein